MGKNNIHLYIYFQAYEERRLTDPDFYRDANSLAYGKTVDDPAAAIDRMVGELNDQCALESCTLYDKSLDWVIKAATRSCWFHIPTLNSNNNSCLTSIVRALCWKSILEFRISLKSR